MQMPYEGGGRRRLEPDDEPNRGVEGLIPQKLENLDRSTHELDEALGLLIDRIDQVLAPDLTETSSAEKHSEPDRAEQSNLSDRLDTIRHRINRITAHIHYTRQRVEL